MKVITERAITFGTPIVDEVGEPSKITKTWNSRQVTCIDHEHIRHKAGELIEVDDEFGKELLKRKLARKPDPALDDDDLVDVQHDGDFTTGANDI